VIKDPTMRKEALAVLTVVGTVLWIAPNPAVGAPQ
jgi:hypothetical protein